MSGGSHGYLYAQIKETYIGDMQDPELDDMMKDLTDLLKALEWWQSGDTSEESYRKAARKFKDKWFRASRTARLVSIVIDSCDELKEELLKMI